ncbi:type II secretion system minor pseudopilin GspH [Pseudomonas cannabina]|uniref:Type II secretion system protein H n=1 Tax=Pseudomonas cannabina TaxID=86840 RepID=A0A0P9QRT2_PSECA|nr:type II secretion system minor pseudopilin GspH [Pseudomonas cannabina]KAA8716022.1 type II secretion system protein GspH [Pseudomonas cannabina]KPW73380.1 proteinral secretion pathway protein H [Pseudomonas cannabina]RMN23753.1 proteinral secretion pathway protein H [Pseudomonas cannabina]SDQ81927.1 general secretion pathway protein H [Pseudomonas cannabina]
MSMPRQSGFTLIELMVVVVIIGIASATISLSIKPDPAALLRKDAERLAQLFQIAQAEARADGRMISWHADAKGFAFRRRAETGSGHDTFNDDPQLRPRNWESPAMRVRVQPGQRVMFNTEWIGTPLRIRLSDGQHALDLQRSALGQLQVVSPP